VTKDTMQDKRAVTNLFIHCADLSGSCKTQDIAKRWSHLVSKEFTEQVCDAVNEGSHGSEAANS
jgi:Mn-dependent DtxR family transcriptional regulator